MEKEMKVENLIIDVIKKGNLLSIQYLDKDGNTHWFSGVVSTMTRYKYD